MAAVKSEHITPVYSQVSHSSRAQALGITDFQFHGTTLWFTGERVFGRWADIRVV